jgi:hypothetical protein
MANCPQINNTTIKGTSAVTYDSTPLPCTDVNTCDGLNVVLAKFDAIICDVTDSVNTLTEDITNATEDLMIIIDDVININDQLGICCSIIIPECSTFITSGNHVSYYNFETNSFTNLFSEGFGNWSDVANTNNKLWISKVGLIKEYDITFNPWTASFNRDIAISPGPGLTAVDNDFLIGSMYSKIILIDISGTTPTYTEIATLPTFGSPYGSSISGDIMLTVNNKLICTVETYTEGSPNYYHYRLLQYDFTTMNLEIVVDLYPIVNGPWGLTENNGNIYIFDAIRKLFSISPTYPYEINEVNVLSEQVLGASIEKSCVTSSFITTTTSSSTTTSTTTIAEIFTHYFSNSSTTPEIACPKFVTAYTLYSSDSLLILNSVLYTNLGLTTPFVGNSKWYKFLSPDEGKVYQINDLGIIISIITCI